MTTLPQTLGQLGDRRHRPVLLHGAGFATVALAMFAWFVTSDFTPLLGSWPSRPETPSAIELTPHAWLLDATNLLPGAWLTKRLELRNKGTETLRYAFSTRSETAGGRDLTRALDLVLRTEGRGCSVFDGALLGAGLAASFRVGDATLGNQPGDRILAAGGSETLCLRVMVALGTADEYQGASTRLALVVDSEDVPGR